MLVRMRSDRNSHMLLVEVQNGTITSEDSLVVSYKTKNTLTIWSSNCVPWYLPNRVENLSPHKNVNTDIYGSFIYNYQNLKATKIYPSADERISCGPSRRWNIIQHWKEMSYQPMKRHGGILDAYH